MTAVASNSTRKLSEDELWTDGATFQALQRGWLPTMAAGFAVAMLMATAAAQTRPDEAVACAETGQDLIRIPEIVSEHGKLRGTIVLSNEFQRMDLRHGEPAAAPCRRQDVRLFRGVDTKLPFYPGAIPAGYPDYFPLKLGEFRDPVPGPTLRARVGDIVQLTFLNHIDTGGFWKTLDRGERETPERGCDENASVPYPGPDAHPNCLHGSSTGNIHFHGTHTTPSTTGDNIFLEIRPSIRGRDGQPIVTAASVKAPFDQFFADCEAQLGASLVSQWPQAWDDLPLSWTKRQEALVKTYDKGIPNKLWPVNARQIEAGAWPQYHIGAFPFCFRLPDYAGEIWPPDETAHPAAHRQGPENQRALWMGQAPGTHWYHAHKHGSTAINVSNGMTGAFIIEGKYDDDLNKFYGTVEVPNPTGSPAPTSKIPWTQTQPVLVINQLGTVPNIYGGGFPVMPFSVNGRLRPRLTMRPGEVQLWRIVNTSSRSGVFFLGFSAGTALDPNSAGFKWKQIAQDGVQFARESYDAPRNTNPHLLIAPGNRADLLVKAPENLSGNFNVLVRDVVRPTQRYGEPSAVPPRPGAGPPPSLTLMTVQIQPGSPVTGRASEFIAGSDYPRFPPFLADIPPTEVRTSRTITFETSPPKDWSPGFGPPFHMHTIDGKKFQGNVGQVVLLNTVEEWKIENRSVRGGGSQDIDHPFHIHINPFQVVEEFAPNEPLVDPATGKPIIDPSTSPDATKQRPFPKYVFDQPAQTIQGVKQCSVSSTDPTTWKPCDDKWQAGNRIWWDVFPIPSGKRVNNVVIPGYFKMRSRFVDYHGQYVIHCHILAHEDRGMMTIVQVAPFETPYTHH